MGDSPWKLKFASDQDNRAPAEEVEEPTEEERALREMNEQEQNGDLFDTPAPYEHWNDIKSKTKTLENLARKDAKVTTSMPKVTEEPTVQVSIQGQIFAFLYHVEVRKKVEIDDNPDLELTVIL